MRKILDKIKVNFEEGGKFARFMPVYDAIDTFLYTPNHTTKSGAHIRDGVDLKRTMFTVIVALIPALLFGIYNTGFQHFTAIGEEAAFMDMVLYGAGIVLPLVLVSYGAGLGVEFIFCIKNGHAIQEGYLVSGMLIPLIMPADVPLWMVAVASAFAVLIGKEVFGGTGMNVFNVALTARAFLFFAYPTMMSGDKVWRSLGDGTLADGQTGATRLGDLATFIGRDSETLAKLKADGEILYANLGEFLSVNSMQDAFLGLIPGSVGETSVLAILIGAAILLFTGVASWRIMFSFFGGGLLMAFLFNVWGANEFMNLPALHQLMYGGFAFGMVFMITDPVTAAQTNTGKYIYGFIGGFLAILIRVFNPAYPEGVMLAILLANVFAPLIDHYVVQANIKRRLNRVKA